MGAVEAESPRLYLRKAGTAADAGKLLGELQLVAALDGDLDHAAALAEGRLDRIGDADQLQVFIDN